MAGDGPLGQGGVGTGDAGDLARRVDPGDGAALVIIDGHEAVGADPAAGGDGQFQPRREGVADTHRIGGEPAFGAGDR